ncbi:triose-phosphate isomerase [Candidatus Bathyarchaeota archaeon]|nr:MAG: triose-phosphate isomerase [Candidatus Bathyarchaeota archaeon]
MASLKVDFPLILVNLKTYREATGEKAVKLAVVAEEVSKRTGVSIAVAPQAIDLRMVVEATEAPVFAQHIDPVGYGKYTGHVLPEAVADAGCAGTLISHSERRLKLDAIEATVKRAKEVSLLPVVCVDTPERGRAVAPFGPDAVAIEPPELIGTGIPVSKARPEVVSGAVEAVKAIDPRVKVLCGAGITSGEDVAAAMKLGAEGVLVASGVVKAEDPYGVLMDLAKAMRR